MKLTALLALASLLTTSTPGFAQDAEAWIARLELPRLYHASLQLNIGDAELGLRGYDLGFPADPAQRIADAQAKLREGDESARVLHQAASGIAAQREREPLAKVLPACLKAYEKEIQAGPGDAALRMGFASALMLAGNVTRDDRFFRDASAQFAAAAELDPSDWRILTAHASMLINRALVAMRSGGMDPAWFGEAVELARTAVEVAPNEAACHWRYFHSQHMLLLVSGGPDGDLPMKETASLADELAAAAGDLADGDRLDIAARSHWFLACVPTYTAEEDDQPEPVAPDEVVRERLAAFRERLAAVELPASFREGVARTFWTLYVFAGDVAEWDAAKEQMIAAGLPDEEATALGLIGAHRRGEPELAARIAAELAESGGGDGALRAIAVYRSRLGEDEAALEALTQVNGSEPDVRIARAMLELKTGKRAEARTALEGLLEELAGTPMVGYVHHALGVALALDGELEPALEQLEIATEHLGDSAVQETVEEVRALAEGGV